MRRTLFITLCTLMLPAVFPSGNAATVQDRLAQYAGPVRARMEPLFKKSGVSFPAARLTLIAIKDTKTLELWAGGATAKSPMRLIKTYPIKAASGVAGPKLREGDRQVPEGIYTIESLNPNSRFHLSLRINYPNAFDRARAKEERRANLGGDIMIHGKAASAGCLAMGDAAAEELFVMAAQTGIKNICVLLCPCDLRTQPFRPPSTAPGWIATVYKNLQTALRDYKQETRTRPDAGKRPQPTHANSKASSPNNSTKPNSPTPNA